MLSVCFYKSAMTNTSRKACGCNKATIDYTVSSLNDALNDMENVVCSICYCCKNGKKSVVKELPELGTILLKLFRILIGQLKNDL